MTSENSYLSSGEPVKVGVLMDIPPLFGGNGLLVYQLMIEQLAAARSFERGVKLITRTIFGPPAGPIKNTTDAYHELVDEGCLVVVGPNHSDSNIAITEHAEARKVPVVALGATAQHMSDYVFSIPWGAIPHDSYLIASWLKSQGCKRITVTSDTATHGAEYLYHFKIAAHRAQLKIIGQDLIPQVRTDNIDEIFTGILDDHRALRPDGIAHLGTSITSSLWAAFVTRSQWDIPRVMNNASSGAYFPEYRDGFEGWVGTTHWDDENQVTREFYSSFLARFPEIPPPPVEYLCIFRDGMTAALEGIKLAPILTPSGVKKGLETIQMLPAASGGARSYISFGPHDHRGLKGADVMVLRRVKDGKLIMEGRGLTF